MCVDADAVGVRHLHTHTHTHMHTHTHAHSHAHALTLCTSSSAQIINHSPNLREEAEALEARDARSLSPPPRLSTLLLNEDTPEAFVERSLPPPCSFLYRYAQECA